DQQLSSDAQSNYALLSDNVKTKNYQRARSPLQWLVTNTPELHESVYVHGINLYTAIESKASSQTAQVIQDSILTLYDLRIKHFNNEKNIIDRKATAAYKFYRNRPEKYEELMKIFDRTYELNGVSVSISNLASYMDVVSKYDSAYDLSNEEVLKRYYKVMEAIDSNNGSSDLDKVRGLTTNLLVKILGDDFNCEFIEKELAPNLNDDATIAKRIIMLSLSQGCTKEDYFAEAAKVLIKENPDYGLIRLVASKEVEKENYDQALSYYDQALASTNDKEKKAKVMVDVAKIHQLKDNYPKAREIAEEALALHPGDEKAYKLIGDLYYNSFDKCKKLEDIVADRSVFWIAYDMYQKAGDEAAMANAKAQFPSISDIFGKTLAEGNSYTVGCWINRLTTIRRRPE
ncbi:tetratricopeptide repeat protein, partial [Fulvivirga aurantia]|uniref:tetratricopeptide repeat protein n=1 Tax=Fulvivirga aurantia TaxID=2529383 RepID=UPI00162894C4